MGNSTTSTGPRFSVILPTHDRRELLREAIHSVASQSFADWELIVVDDASRDPIRAEELQAWVGDRARLLALNPSQGGAGAKSAGAVEARGEVLAFLDDDDLWDPAYLERADRALRAAPEARVLFMGVKWFGERAKSGQEAQDRGMGIIRGQTGVAADARGLCRHEQDALFAALLERVPMPFQRPVVYREDYRAIGPYRAECLLWDCDWALRAVLHGQCALLDEGLYLQRAAGQGYSSQGRRALEHARSNLEIKESLLRHPAVNGTRRLPLVKRALHRDWKGYAWQLRQQGERREAGEALRSAAKYGFSMELARMWLAIALRSSSAGKP
ncbi:MAG: glycosyltransferase family 2 protein [Hydrogenophilales bacterium]|jgi:glycosyltransferase involved in cell wall biosynthesis|nr:glycosyltransferase family 2 protein [Hydrogenophilales bacterium]MBP8902729.1 glycosyltransferase family 2 protein [Thiobacillaceae bacterium]